MTAKEDDGAARLWPTTRFAVNLIDGMHTATGLPWWATLSLTALGMPYLSYVSPIHFVSQAVPSRHPHIRSRILQSTSQRACICTSLTVHICRQYPSTQLLLRSAVSHLPCQCAGVRALLLPFTLKQMHASSTLMSEWRLATRRAAMQQAQASSARAQPRWAPQKASSVEAGPARALRTDPNGSPAYPAAGSPGAALLSWAGVGASRDSGSKRTSSEGLQSEQAGYRQLEPGSTDTRDEAGSPNVNSSVQADESSSSSSSDESRSNGTESKESRQGHPGMGSILKEYRRIRGGSSAAHPSWLIGSPLLQVW